MQLPEASRAVVEDAKVREYLLSPDHPIGRFKARVFAAAGYRRDEWSRLQADLRALAVTIDVAPVTPDAYGQRFVGAGVLPGIAGMALPVVTVWLIPFLGEPPRLITAYPGGEP
jgi:hypothetical protein